MNATIATVFVVEDDARTRDHLAGLFSLRGFPTEIFASGKELLECLNLARSGCVVADCRLSAANGIRLQEQLAHAGCTLPLILINVGMGTRASSSVLAQRAFEVLTHPFDDEELVIAAREALVHDSAIRQQKAEWLDFAHRLESLDARERCVLDLIVAGNANKSIEHRLGLSKRTVDRIRASILEKMESLSFVELSGAYGMYVAASQPGRHAIRAAAEIATNHRSPTGLGSQVRHYAFPKAGCNPQLFFWDLHDEAARRLTTALTRLATVEARSDLPREAGFHLGEIRASLAMAVAEIRGVIATQSAEGPQGSGTARCIERFARAFARTLGVAVEFDQNLDDDEIPSLQREAIYRILRECLVNAVRHSGTDRVRVELRREIGSLRLEFRDWGRGFDIHTVNTNRQGLRSIHRRAESLGGKASIASSPGKGTQVRMDLPLSGRRGEKTAIPASHLSSNACGRSLLRRRSATAPPDTGTPQSSGKSLLPRQQHVSARHREREDHSFGSRGKQIKNPRSL